MSNEPKNGQAFEGAECLLRVFERPTPPTLESMRGIFDLSRKAELDHMDAVAKAERIKPKNRFKREASTDYKAARAKCTETYRARQHMSEVRWREALTYGQGILAPLLYPYIEAGIKSLPDLEWVKVNKRTLRSLFKVHLPEGDVTFDLFATFDSLGLLEEFSAFQFSETEEEREKSIGQDFATYLMEKKRPLYASMVYQLRSTDKSDQKRQWTADSKQGFGLTELDIRACTELLKMISEVLSKLQEAQMPPLSLVERSCFDIAQLHANLIQREDSWHLTDLEALFPQVRDLLLVKRGIP